MNTKTIALALAMLPVALGGCTQQSTLGNAISSEGAAIAAIGTKWSKGHDLIEQGQDQIDEGNEMIDDGNDLIQRGEDNIELGRKMKKEAETEYEARTGKALPAPNP
ncbi:MAG: hypothetical protein KDH19_05810 [Geminicoccaceae bacterium]|nr:hypothetical protein [Geminicoccaceae bacterium]